MEKVEYVGTVYLFDHKYPEPPTAGEFLDKKLKTF